MTTVKKLSMIAIGAAVWAGITNPVSAIMLSIGGTSVPGQGQFSSVAGATTINFESGAPTSGPAIYSAPGVGPTVVSGNMANVFAAPSDDYTKYLTVAPFGDWRGNNPVTISFTEKIDYFGLYWGSWDNYNSIAFYQDNTLLKLFTGNDILASQSYQDNTLLNTLLKLFPGNDVLVSQIYQDKTLLKLFTDNYVSAANINFYTNFFAETNEFFNKVVLGSSAPAFETDNHAYRVAESVPEPTTILGTLAFGTFAARWRIKRKQQEKSLNSTIV
jgi:hypothetical protein